MIRLKLKAGALQLTTFIIVVIALLLTAFILLVHTHKQFQVQSDFIVESVKQANYGIEYAIKNSLKFNDTISIETAEEDSKQLKIHRDFWGVFEKVISVSKIKNKQIKKIALIGSKQSELDRKALYIQDNDKPLVLVRNTKIEGLAYLPKQGVKPGYIAGQSYYGSRLVYGSVRQSFFLPKIDQDLNNQLEVIEDELGNVTQEQFVNIVEGDQLINSFFNPMKVIFSNATIDLIGSEITGHILIQSKTKIVVHPSSKLKDVILVAPEVEIQNEVNGNFQVIASEQIVVGNNVQLNYPSALIVNEKKVVSKLEGTQSDNEKWFKIIINDNSEVKGVIVFKGQEKPNNYKVQLDIKEKAVIYGELYCNQNIELLGTVYGTVFTNNFIANQSGSIYQNHIYNGKISIEELPQEYVGLLLTDSEKDVLQWLY